MRTATEIVNDLKTDDKRNLSLADEAQIRLLLEILNELRTANGKATITL